MLHMNYHPIAESKCTPTPQVLLPWKCIFSLLLYGQKLGSSRIVTGHIIKIMNYRILNNVESLNVFCVRGRTFMLTVFAVLAQLTLWEMKNKSFVLLSWFSGTPYTGTHRTNQIKCIVSQLAEAYALHENNNNNSNNNNAPIGESWPSSWLSWQGYWLFSPCI
jgi:hypothetical protein